MRRCIDRSYFAKVGGMTYAYEGEADATDDQSVRQELHQCYVGVESLDIIRKRYYPLMSDNQKSHTCDDRSTSLGSIAADCR